VFPHPTLALPSGLLAVGGDLSPERLLLAYRFGIFPWYSEGEPILWWCTSPRFVLFQKELHIPKSMRSILKRNRFKITLNEAFPKVIRMCKDIPRFGQEGSWINDDMIIAYQKLHDLGYVESVEVWDGKVLVGGLYGVKINKIFFGESMFSLLSNASKFGFIKYVEYLGSKGFNLIDCQQETDHLRRFGAKLISQDKFQEYLRNNWMEK
jgi:leucyl/phenylalanyl-tRNA--protein transferase